MRQARMAFTAVYVKSRNGYVSFVEELPGVNAYGRSIEEARDRLHELARVVFDAERENAQELLAGKDTVREPLVIPLPAAAQQLEEKR